MGASTLPRVPDDFSGRIVLGIDPGTLVVGYGAIVLRPDRPVLLAAGVLRAPAKEDVPSRLGFLLGELTTLMARLKPAVVAVEEAFCGPNVQSALRIGEGRGVVLAVAVQSGAEVLQYPPAVAKRTIAGNGGASKDQVAQMVARELRLDRPPSPLDATDALALALTYVHRSAALGRL